MGKYFKVRVGDYSLGYFRNQELLDQEAALDGIYVVRTSVPKAELGDQEAVLAYKRLALLCHKSCALVPPTRWAEGQ